MAEIHLDDLARFCRDALAVCGLSAEDAEIVTASILHAHTHGKGTHGVGRLDIYARKITEGLMRPDTPLTEIAGAPAMALLDADHGFGQVAAYRGMHRACDMAAECGIAVVGIRHSNSFGTAAWVASQAAARGMAGFVFTNAGPAIAPTGGRRALWGTNPLAFACPAHGAHPPIVLDMATAAAARSKIRLAEQNGEKIPTDWALDTEGNPTDDPTAALAGSMIPLGGPKGSGLAMMLDILSGLMTGSGFAGAARALNDPSEKSDVGHMMIALDIAKFMDPADYARDIAQLIATTKATGDAGAVAMPGERGARYMEGREGRVPISGGVMKRIDAVTRRLGVAPIVVQG
jgi:LDH2 family malate/lactate/ureidoglycolate dehydrogenase